MQKTFEREVIERLTVLETLIKNQDYASLAREAEEAHNLSISNKEKIDKIEDSIKWIVRLILGALVLGILAFVYGM